MNRNAQSIFSRTPTPHFGRTLFHPEPFDRTVTMAHGILTPVFTTIIYPGDTFTITSVASVKMDTSVTTPLDNIYLDTYFFYVPFRIIDPNFKSVEGEKEPYDTNNYTMPSFKYYPGKVAAVSGSPSFKSQVLDWTMWRMEFGSAHYDEAGHTPGSSVYHELSCYPIWAYCEIWNQFFRDENVDYSIPFTNLANGVSLDGTDTSLYDIVSLKPVNRFHDYFSSSLISPQKGPEVTIGLSGLADVIGAGEKFHTVNYPNQLKFVTNSGSESARMEMLGLDYASGGTRGTLASDVVTRPDSPALVTQTNMVADLSTATAVTINQLRLSFALQTLYERRALYGTRYIEQLRGLWGLDVPDYIVQRPEYLGGTRAPLSMLPVFDNTSSSLGSFAGNSSTVVKSGQVFKSFSEKGLLILVACTRVKHTYSQGRDDFWDLKDSLDSYNPVFANTGYQGTKNKRIYDQGDQASANNEVFAYQEPYAHLRTFVSRSAGLMNPASASDLAKYWLYQDAYAAKPVFSSTWLKEPQANVNRTLTGRLISGAATTGNQAFMFRFMFDIKMTRTLPSRSIPVSLVGRV